VPSAKRIVRHAARTARSVVAVSRAVNARLGGLPREGEIRVSYGHVSVPRATDFAQGGIVKLQGLTRRYPNSTRRFNVLYLVSSRLPNEPAALARAARAKGAAVVVNQNGVAYPAWHGAGWEKTNAPMARVLQLASHVFYQSQFCKDTADRFLAVRPHSWEVLHNAVDTDRFVPASDRKPRPLTMLLGGSQDAWYRVETAVRTLASLSREIPDARLLIAGRLKWSSEATPRADLERLIAQLGLADRVDLLGTYTQAAAPALYQRADMLLHTKYNDPCPSVVVEAMASGLPVVFSRSGGVPELVGDAGVGIPAEVSWERDIPPPPDKLADAVLAVAARRTSFSSAARARAVEHFSLDAWLERHERTFHDLTCRP
jgi:glycosyltransferase involved in cell wall biosynthesis